MVENLLDQLKHTYWQPSLTGLFWNLNSVELDYDTNKSSNIIVHFLFSNFLHWL